MRILVVHGRYRSAAPSGENIVADQERSALRAAGHWVGTFERDSDEIAGWSLARKASLPARVVWNGAVKRDLVRSIAATRPDVVHIHNTFPLLSPSVLHACLEAGVPAVATFHNYRLLCATGDFFRAGQPCHDCASGIGMPGVQHGCYRGSHLATIPVVAANVAHRLAWQRLLSAYVFISASQRDLMSALELPADRVFVKHNLVVSPPSPAPSPRALEHQVTYVGRLDAAKGIPLLMQAWDAFRAQSPSSALRLVVVGAGPMEDAVRAWAAHQPSVEVVGLVPRDEAVSVLGRSLAAVVTSQWEETFGLVAVEAMAVGVAPIAPDRGSFPELIGDRADGSLYRAGDPASLAAALTDLDRDPQRYVELGRRARASYERRFQPQANLDQLLDIYRFAMAHPVEGLQRALRTSASG